MVAQVRTPDGVGPFGDLFPRPPSLVGFDWAELVKIVKSWEGVLTMPVGIETGLLPVSATK